MKILFVCRGNMFRSQVAEAVFNHIKDGGVEVKSCGTWVEKEGLTDKRLKDFDGQNEEMNLTNLIEVMKEKGIDISENVCKPITPELVDWADKIISMAEVDESPDYLLKSQWVTFWKVENPDSFTKEFARELIEQIEKLVSTQL